jgi:hypothetical protein
MAGLEEKDYTTGEVRIAVTGHLPFFLLKLRLHRACRQWAARGDQGQGYVVVRTFQGRQDACYDLGPAVLTVRRAQAQMETQPDGVAVFLKLSPADTPVLGRILSDNLYKQVALVMFGRVQTAPTVQDTETDGSIAIAGLDPQTAENVVKALSG